MTWAVSSWEGVAGLVHGFGNRHTPPPSGVVTLRQVHGRVVLRAGDVLPSGSEGDGLLAGRNGEVVGVWTADCVPVLLVAPERRVAAAVHAGWRGSVAGVVEAALERFETEWGVPASAIEASLGPSIGGCCYEVGEEVLESFRRVHGRAGEVGFERRDGRLHLDLRTFHRGRLQALGLARVERTGPCTACHGEALCSYRREGSTGRQLSWIGWRG